MRINHLSGLSGSIESNIVPEAFILKTLIRIINFFYSN